MVKQGDNGAGAVVDYRGRRRELLGVLILPGDPGCTGRARRRMDAAWSSVRTADRVFVLKNADKTTM